MNAINDSDAVLEARIGLMIIDIGRSKETRGDGRDGVQDVVEVAADGFAGVSEEVLDGSGAEVVADDEEEDGELLLDLDSVGVA